MGLGGTDLNLIKVLDALLREGSTVRAGARLGLSQPAVSAALSRLRQTLGDPLFVRRGRGLEATDHARSLAPTVARLMQEIEGLLEARASFDPTTERRVFRSCPGAWCRSAVLRKGPSLIRTPRRAA